MFKFLPLLLLALSASAHADRRVPMIQVGGGVEADNGGDINVLLRLEYEGITTNRGAAVHWFFARLKADVAFNASDAPYVDVEFIGAVLGTNGINSGLPGELGWNFRVMPVHYTRNVSVSNLGSTRISVAGFEIGTGTDTRRQALVPFARVAADALGFKAAQYLLSSGRDAQYGFSLAAADASVGLAAGDPSGKFSISVAFGARADLAFTIAGVQSDVQLYTELRSHFAEFFHVFVRGAYNASLLTGSEPGTEWQLMAGAGFQY